MTFSRTTVWLSTLRAIGGKDKRLPHYPRNLVGCLLSNHTENENCKSMKHLAILALDVLLMVGLAIAASPDDRNVLIMDGEESALWRSFESSEACLGLRGVKMFDNSNRETFRWSMSITGDGRGDFEVLLSEMPTKHNVLYGTDIPKGVSRACKTIKGEIKREQ